MSKKEKEKVITLLDILEKLGIMKFYARHKNTNVDKKQLLLNFNNIKDIYNG